MKVNIWQSTATLQYLVANYIFMFPDWEEDSHEDSGMASSFEENIIVTNEKNNQVNNNNSVNSKPKSKRMTKRRSKQIQMANELIFDLDI